MRAIVYLLLGGALLWFVWENSGLARAKSEATETDAPGVLLPVETSVPADVAADVAAPVGDDSNEPRGVPHANSTIDAVSRASEAASASATTADSVLAATPAPAAPSDRALEIAVASELVHRPGRLADFLSSKARDLPAAQRAFAIVFAGLASRSADESRAAAQSARDAAGLSVDEIQLLDQLAGAVDLRAVPASASTEAPLVRAAAMCWLAHDAERALVAAQYRDASRLYSDLMLEELEAPWPADAETLRRWSAALARAQSRYSWDKTGDWPSIDVKVERGDSLISIRKRVIEQHPDLLVCTGQIERANGIRGTTIQPGQTLRVPTTRAHVLVDLDAHWVFYVLGDVVAGAWEAGIGKTGSETRPGSYTVGEKRTEPMWFPPGKEPVPFGDPANPLGTRWISWLNPDGSASRLGFHGTNDPDSIGHDRSEGCIRLRNADVEELYEILPRGASITVRP